MPGQLQQIRHVQHDLVGKKGQVAAGEPVGQAVPLAEVNEGQGALVVAEEHRQFLPPAHPLKQPGELFLPFCDLYDLQRTLVAAGGPHDLGTAVPVARHKVVGGIHDLSP